jgi:hypothetical protein
MQQSIAIQQPQHVKIQRARRGLHERWVHEFQHFRSVVGVGLFTPSEGGTLIVKQDDGWNLPMHPVTGRDSAPFRIPFTVAKNVLGIDPDTLQYQPQLVGEVADDDNLFIIVRMAIPNRLRFDNAKFVKGDSCIAALDGVNPFVASTIAYARTHHALSWAARTATLQ